MSKLIFYILLFFSPLLLLSQEDCKAFLPSEGTKLTYINYNKKGKQQSTTTTEVKSVKVEGDTTIFRVYQLVSTGKKKNDYESNMVFKCAGDKFVIDMKSVLSSEMMTAYKDASAVVTSEDMSIPSNLEPGMELDDGSIDVMVRMDPITTNITARAFYRKVLGKEDVQTPAGDFTAWKIEGNVESKVTFMRVAIRTVQWFVEDVGVVRSESYDNKDKLLGYTELQSIQ